MRYVTQPKGNVGDWDGWSEPCRINPTVDGPKQVDTGLLDEKGNRIFRVQPPIGFGRDAEW